MIAAILGAGNMGTALAVLAAKNCEQVRLWNHEGDPEPLAQIRQARENKKYLPGIKLAENIMPEFDLHTAISGASMVVFAVPSNFMEGLIERAAPALACGMTIVDASKGLDEKSLGLMSDVFQKKLPHCVRREIASISGPAIASDMARGGFTAMNVASHSRLAIAAVRRALESDALKLVPTTDVVGVEVAGSFKNVYAIAMGICDGLGYPLNTKSALLVVALREISTLIKKMGGKTQTVYDLAGLGDLVGTGLCTTSRNRRFGELIATGMSSDVAARSIGQVVEGIRAIEAIHKLSIKHHITMPFAQMIYDIVIAGRPPRAAVSAYLSQFS